MLAKNTRKLRPWGAFSLLVAAACSSHGSIHNTSAHASPTRICAEVGGTWDQTSSTCYTTGTNAQHVTITISAKYPFELVGDPTAGPALGGFLHEFFTKFGHPDDSVPQGGVAKLDYKTYEHSSSVRSVVFNKHWFLKGEPHPNDTIDTFTFDLAQQKQLALTDLFCPGTDPLTALPPFVTQHLQSQLDPRWVQPGNHGTDYSNGYKAWYLDGEDLVLIMPATRMGPVHAGAWQPHIPLSDLKSILRENGCSV